MKVRGSALLAPAGEAYQAAKLRWATLADSERLERLFSDAGRERTGSGPGMTDWLEHGGALLLEDRSGLPVCAVRWRDDRGDGWLLDSVATLPEARSQGFGRWLMTKVEALAIRYNIPSLTVEVLDRDELGYYRRLGYRPAEESAEEVPLLLSKRVGGTWQLQAASAR